MGWTQASKAKNVSSVKKPLSISVSQQPRGVVECIAWCCKYLNPLNLNCRRDSGLMYSSLYVKDPPFTGLKSVQAALHQIIPCNLQTILFQMTLENNNKYSFLIKTIIFPFWANFTKLPAVWNHANVKTFLFCSKWEKWNLCRLGKQSRVSQS